jgi:hypothetical protein
MRRCVAIGGLLLLGLLPRPAEGISVFAREGLGEWLEGYDMRGQTLGGTGIGLVDPYNFTGLNPAATAFSPHTLGHTGIATETNWASDAEATARQQTPMITEVGVFVPLGHGLGMRLILEPATDAVYTLEQNVPTGWETIEEDIRREEGSRGPMRIRAGASWRGASWWALGAGVSIVSGSIVDQTRYVFGDSAAAAGWQGGSDRRELRFHSCTAIDLGFLARPTERISLGGFYSTSVTSSVTETYQSVGGTDWTVGEVDVDLPAGAGAGLGLLLSRRWRLSGDLLYRAWEDVRIGGKDLPRAAIGPWRNTLRWGAGLERLGSTNRNAGLLARIFWRIGFAWIPWYLEDAGGEAIDEWRVSAGAGVPIRGDRGMIDLLLAYGRRGALETNGLEEEYLRLGLAFTFARVLREY